MNYEILSSNLGFGIMIIWFVIIAFSAIIQTTKEAKLRNYKKPKFNRNNRKNSLNSNINKKSNFQTTSQFEEVRMTEAEYSREEEFRNQANIFGEIVPSEQVEEYVPDEQVEEYVPDEYVEEYVPEEFGEENGPKQRDNFYHSTEIKNALQDEEDLARKKAYQRKFVNAFEYNPISNKKKKKSAKAFFEKKPSLKRAIIYSEVLGKPKSIREDTRF